MAMTLKRTVSLISAAALTTLLLLAACGCAGDDRAYDGILLITVDTLRADRLGCTGRAGAATPVLDALAGRGVLFDHLIVTAPITLPSHASLMAGRLPHELGIRDNRPYALSNKAETLAEVLSGAGYRTLAVVSGEPLAPGCGLDQGFERYVFKPGPRRADVLLRESDARRTVNTVLEEAARLDPDRPFFMWVHFFDPHVPYTPPLKAPSGDPYDGEVALADREIGRLLEGLKAAELMERTLVIVTSDHGEGLGDHGEATHAYFLYDSTLRVPLIVAGPGIEPGRRTAAPIRMLDLHGAVLALLGLPGARSPSDAARLSAYLIAGAEPPESRPVFSESVFCYKHFRWAQLTSLRTGALKAVQGARTEIFDLVKDPGENAPLDPADAGPDGLALARLLEERTSKAENPGEPGPRLLGSLPGYFGNTGVSGKPFLAPSENAAFPHPHDRKETLGRFLEAVELSQSGHLNRARFLLEEVLEGDPDNPSCAFWLGRVLRSLGEKEGASDLIERARTLFQEALRLDPEYADAYHMSVWCLLQLGRFEEARTSLDGRLASHPEDPKGLELYGYVLTTAESNARKNPILDMESGLRAFQRSIELDQNNPRLLQKLADLYKSLDRPDMEAKYRALLMKALQED